MFCGKIDVCFFFYVYVGCLFFVINRFLLCVSGGVFSVGFL